jgi:hypothetical protein
MRRLRQDIELAMGVRGDRFRGIGGVLAVSVLAGMAMVLPWYRGGFVWKNVLF